MAMTLIEADNDTGDDRPGVLLDIRTVSPVTQEIVIDGKPHTMKPYSHFGVVRKAEIQRDWNRYSMTIDRIVAGEVITADEAALADLAMDRILRACLETVAPREWDDMASGDKEALIALFFQLNAANLTARREAENVSIRSIMGR